MPRNQNAGNLALRNRNRVTNKTRLKVIKGNIDADPIVLDEDEERARVVSTAGVDAEDANEHHLQAVLSAASHRATALAQKSSRASPEKHDKRYESNTVFIPVPDAAGVVDNYSDLYPADKWKDPASYVKFSSTVDECINLALADGFTYFMDERDSEWLERNNQEARGEGTSTQANSANGTTTRSGSVHRSAKSKGKDVDASTPIVISEDDFELVMGVFEKVTHDNTPFLHVSLQQGTPIPPFSEYQDVFISELPASMFATYMRPSRLPQPANLCRMARVVYPYWRERKTEREGQRIIPTLNFDESDAKNESYVCFRRREIKAVRKTRTTQVTMSDKLIRLRGELGSALDLSRTVLSRESQKRESLVETKNVWERRRDFVDLKRKFPALGGRDEEELLFDKERLPKKAKPQESTLPAVLRIKRASGELSASPTPQEPAPRPKDRLNGILSLVDEQLKRQKERDHHWEDQLDNPYQIFPTPLPDRFFKATHSFETVQTNDRRRETRQLRLRVGRGGRMHLDRRNIRLSFASKQLLTLQTRRLRLSEEAEEFEFSEDRLERLQERWRYDSDTSSTPSGADDDERILLDDFEPRYLRHSVQLLQDTDHQYLSTDPRLFLSDGNNGFNVVLPFRVGAPPTPRRDSVASQRPATVPGAVVSVPLISTQQPALPTAISQSIAIQTPVKKVTSPVVLQQVHTPTNGPQRPPSSLSQASANDSTNHSDVALMVIPNASAVNTMANGIVPNISSTRQASTLSNNVVNGHTQSNGLVQAHEASNHGISPPRPKSVNQGLTGAQMTGVNGFGMGAVNGTFTGFPAVNANFNGLTAAQQQHAMNVQQAQTLKRAYAGIQNQQGVNGQSNLSMNGARPVHAQFNGLANGLNSATLANLGGMNGIINNLGMTLKMPATRQMQFPAQQRSQQAQVNGIDMQSNGMQMSSANGGGHLLNGHLSPPSRPLQSPPNQLNNQNQDRSSPTHQHLLAQALSSSPRLGSPQQSHLTPQRNMQTPIPTPSPLLQHQQVLSGLNQGQSF